MVLFTFSFVVLIFFSRCFFVHGPLSFLRFHVGFGSSFRVSSMSLVCYLVILSNLIRVMDIQCKVVGT